MRVENSDAGNQPLTLDPQPSTPNAMRLAMHIRILWDMSTTAAVVGASGYAGGELIRILDAHPGFTLELLVAHSRAGETLAAVHPHLTGGDRELVLFDIESCADADVVFLALPPPPAPVTRSCGVCRLWSACDGEQHERPP